MSDIKSENDLGNLPRYALFRGRKVQIAWYTKDSPKPFHIILWDDSQRDVSREQLTFMKPKKKG